MAAPDDSKTLVNMEEMGTRLRDEANRAKNAANFNTKATMDLFAQDAARATARATAAASSNSIVVYDSVVQQTVNKIDNRHRAASSDAARQLPTASPPPGSRST